MLTNYLEMIQSVERDREALLFSDRVYTYGNLADLALEKQKQLHLENRKQQLAVIRESSILEQLVSFLACQGTGAVPLIVPADTAVPDAFFEAEIPENACMAVMTSGTTGNGKLLFRTFESWYGYFETQNRIFGRKPSVCAGKPGIYREFEPVSGAAFCRSCSDCLRSV